MTEIGPGWSNVAAPIVQDEHHGDAAAKKIVLRGTDGASFFNAAVVSTASGPALVTLGGGSGGGEVTQGTTPWIVSVASQTTVMQGTNPWVCAVVSQVTTPVVITGIPSIGVVSQVTTPVVITGTPSIGVVSQVTTNCVITGTPSFGVVSCLSLRVDTELPEAAALSDALANPTTPQVGSNTLLWNDQDSRWERTRMFSALTTSYLSSGVFPGTLGVGVFGYDLNNGYMRPLESAGLGSNISSANNSFLVSGLLYWAKKGLTNYSPMRTLAAADSVYDANLACGMMCATGTSLVAQAVLAAGADNLTVGVPASGTMVNDGTNWDRLRGVGGVATIAVISAVTTNVVVPLYRGTFTTLLSTFTLGSGTTTVNGDGLTTTIGSWIEMEYTITSLGVGAHRVQILPQFANDGSTYASVDSGPETNMHFEDTEFVAAKTLVEIFPTRGALFRPQAKAVGVSDTLLFAVQIKARERQSP